MPTDPKPEDAAEQPQTFTLEDVEKLVGERVNAALAQVSNTVNAAVTGQLKRIDFAGMIAKALPAQSAQAGAQGDAKPDAATQPSPAEARLAAKLAELEARDRETTAKYAAREREVAREAARVVLREQLAAKGVSAVRARAAINDLEMTKALRFDENGAPVLAIKRARTKGARPEELVFEDLSDGLADWAQTPDAAEFLPAPSQQANAAATARTGVTRIPAGGPRAALPTTAPDTEDGAAAAALALLESRS